MITATYLGAPISAFSLFQTLSSDLLAQGLGEANMTSKTLKGHSLRLSLSYAKLKDLSILHKMYQEYVLFSTFIEQTLF